MSRGAICTASRGGSERWSGSVRRLMVARCVAGAGTHCAALGEGAATICAQNGQGAENPAKLAGV